MFKGFLLLLLLLSPAATLGQTISPVVQELSAKPGKPFNGSFTVTNNSVTPIIAVTGEPKTLVFQNGRPTVGPLNPLNTVELSRMSAKIGAKQSFTFYWRATCVFLPCAFELFANLSSATHSTRGLKVVLVLPSVTYACQKAKGCRASVIDSSAKAAGKTP